MAKAKAKKVYSLESETALETKKADVVKDETIMVTSSLGFMRKDKRFEFIEGNVYKVLPSALKENEKLVEKNGRMFVEFTAQDQATYLM